MNYYSQIQDLLLSDRKIALKTVLKGDSGKVETELIRQLVEAVPELDEKGHMCYRVQSKILENRIEIIEPITPSERLIIFGGGHIAVPLCEFASKCGFSVTVVDDREAFANRERFPYASQVIQNRFEESIEQLHITAYDYVVIVTRGHTHDGVCLEKILKGVNPLYTGMIGSRRRVQAQFAMLLREGYSKERLDQIHTPIGLNIGGVTPTEIAIAILAELIACKRLPQERKNPDICRNNSDFEVEMLTKLANVSGPAALVTLLKSSGSTPRKPGAKMLVYQDRKIEGTIGGGLSEARSIQEAIKIIGTGTYRIMNFDMSGSVTEADGMACGGVAEVLIEDFI